MKEGLSFVLFQLFLWGVFILSMSLIAMDSVLWIGLYSLLVSLFICCLVGMTFSSWFGAISVVVYVGGLLVMFSYFLAICPNQPINVKASKLAILGLVGLGFSVLVKVSIMPSMGWSGGSVSIFYSLGDGGFLIFLALVLFLALVSVVKVVEVGQGPLRPYTV